MDALPAAEPRQQPSRPQGSLPALEVQPDTCSAIFLLLERVLMRFFWLAGSVVSLGNCFMVFLKDF